LTAPDRGAAADGGAPRSRAARLALVAAALLACAGFLRLGNWQLERRAWKLDLIDRVEQRVHAPPVAAPGPGDWPRISAYSDEYRRVRLAGTFLHDRETLVQASTVLGGGYWVLTPLRTADCATVLVNRGFVAPAQRDRSTRDGAEPRGEVAVTGLLRISEPGGSPLRRNDALSGRWYSRDVPAIAAARGLEPACVAPYFVDAEAAPPRPRDGAAGATGLVGGLTVIAFQNNHLVYALTWYGLALMSAGAAAYALLAGRLRQGGGAR